MYKCFVRTVGLTCLVAVLGLGTQAQGAATITLKAVAKNGAAIAPTNSLNIAPNDTIRAEVYISGWSNPPFDGVGGSGLVQIYQALLLGTQGVLSNTPDTTNNALHVLPLGWDAPIVKQNCPCDPGSAFPVCGANQLAGYGCIGPAFNPATLAGLQCTGVGVPRPCCAGANIPCSDYIFLGFSDFSAVANDSLNISWGATINSNDGQTASRCAGGSNAGGSCSTGAECPGGTCDANFPSYAGTLNLKAGAQVCGTTIFTFDNNLNTTFIGNPGSIPVFVTPAIQGLTLTVPTNPNCAPVTGPCCNDNAGTCQDNVTLANCPGGRWAATPTTCATMNPVCTPRLGGCCVNGTCTDGKTQVQCTALNGRWAGPDVPCSLINPPCNPLVGYVSANPPNCAIDARQPYPPSTPGTRQGFNSWIWTFNGPPGSTEDAPNDFTVRQVPAATPPIPPTISSVTPAGSNLTFTLSSPIQPNHWYCIKRNADGLEKCLGFQSADADNNNTATPTDILKIIDNLNHIVNPALPLYQCDIDRGGTCGPTDILREIDLLNGVTGYQVQNGKTIGVCPTPGP